MRGAVKRKTDSILLPFLSSSSELDDEQLVADLLASHAAPIIADIIESTINPLAYREGLDDLQEAQDIEDIIGEANTSLLNKLRRLKDLDDDPIESFSSYVAVVAYNACHAYLRAKYPLRTRLKYKLRYSLTRRAEFALWEGVDGKWVCGFSQWRGQRKAIDRGWINQALMDPSRFVHHGQTDDVIDLLRAAFMSSNAPIILEDLVSLIAQILGISSDRFNSGIEDRYHKNGVVDPFEGIERKEKLKLLWTEILLLPPFQRMALLLGARDARRTSIPVLLTELHIASVCQVAVAVNMQAVEFHRMLPDLPLHDKTIAGLIGVSRQQVVSYRYSARRRLERRMYPDR